MANLTIGIDVGTTGTKVVLLDPGARILATASRSTRLFSDGPGRAEASPTEWLDNSLDAMSEVLAHPGIRRSDVAAVATTGMVPAVVLLGDDRRPLRRAILQNDARTTREVSELAETLSPIDLVATTGSALTQQSVAPTLGWVQRDEPDVWARTRYIVGSYDHVLMALGADAHVEGNWALESGLFDLDGNGVSEVFDAVDCPRELVPPVQHSASVVGAIEPAIANRLGLDPSVQLIVGGADHVLSAYSAGVAATGDCLVKLGGAGDILVASSKPVTDRRLYLDEHPVPGMWLPNGCMATSGSLLRWFQEMSGGDELTTLDHDAEQRAPADVLCLPYFLGEKSPIHDADLRGAFVGLHLGHDRSDMYRSILEAIAFGFRHHMEVFDELTIAIDRILVTNGGSRSTLWKQIHADVLGIDLTSILDHPGASLGAAQIASIGLHDMDWGDASSFARIGEVSSPNPQRTDVYDEAYHRWRHLGDVLAPVSHELARRTTP